jgi:hypothetical protein
MTTCLRVAIAIVAALAAASSAESAAADQRSVLPPDARIAGEAQPQWSVRWWQWAASFDYPESPVADRTGERCAAGQDGPVWFLAGVYGSAPVKRTCEVPAGKWLFFPIVNYVVFPPDGSTPSCQTVTAQARASTDDPVDLAVFVDGASVANLAKHRQSSADCFNLGERAGQDVYPAASNGYYVMLRPLPPGKHEIKWGGVLQKLRQAVVYEIVVKDDAAPGAL